MRRGAISTKKSDFRPKIISRNGCTYAQKPYICAQTKCVNLSRIRNDMQKCVCLCGKRAILTSRTIIMVNRRPILTFPNPKEEERR